MIFTTICYLVNRSSEYLGYHVQVCMTVLFTKQTCQNINYKLTTCMFYEVQC